MALRRGMQASLLALAARLSSRHRTVQISQLARLGRLTGSGVHLAIATRPYLEKILAGRKTIESRFAKVRCAPFGIIAPGDTILFKLPGGCIRAAASVRAVQFYGPLDPGGIRALMKENARELSLDDSFQRRKQESKYATLIFISDALRLPPIPVEKRDRRSWVKLNESRQETLFGRNRARR